MLNDDCEQWTGLPHGLYRTGETGTYMSILWFFDGKQERKIVVQMGIELPSFKWSSKVAQLDGMGEYFVYLCV